MTSSVPMTTDMGYIPNTRLEELAGWRQESAHTSRQRLSQTHHVRLDTGLMVVGERCPASAKARLHLINDEEDIVLLAQLSDGLQVPIRRNVDTAGIR